MVWVKRLTGFVTALFCTLLIAALCEFCCEIDFKWLASLVKPSFTPKSLWLNLMSMITYASLIAVITRLVVGKHFFPSMGILALTGVFSVLLVYSFFNLKMIYLALIFDILLVAVSFAQLVRFFIKDYVVALMYLPAFLVNGFSLVLLSSIAMLN